MTPNAFIGRTDQPSEQDLAVALGSAKTVWDQLLSDITRENGATGREWKCHSPKWGWSVRVKRKERTIVWLSPSQDCFTVLFILGAKAMAAARQTKLPPRLVQVMDTAPKYPEGTGVRLEVKSSRDLPMLRKLAAIKVAN